MERYMNTMVRKINLLLLFLLIAGVTQAQYRSETLSKQISNLGSAGIDTILVYTAGCYGECEVTHKPNCNCDRSLSSTFIIYQHKGKYYFIDFSCCNVDEVKTLKKSQSVPYFLSMKAVLKEENRFYKNLKFPPPIPSDNPFENAELMIKKQKLQFYIFSDQKNASYKAWRKHPWIDKQIRLLQLIKKDIKAD
jgi:hypothetical protein